MKITFYHDLITHTRGSVQYKLFQDLYVHAYERTYTRMWKPDSHSTTLWKLNYPAVNLNHMAHTLRQQDWKIYYWRDLAHDYDDHVSHGAEEGLIIGKYCANITAWLLMNT